MVDFDNVGNNAPNIGDEAILDEGGI